MTDVQRGGGGAAFGSPIASEGTVASGGAPGSDEPRTVTGHATGTGELEGLEVTVTYQCVGLDAWTMEVSIPEGSRVGVESLVLSVPYSCASVELTGVQGEGDYQRSGGFEAIGDGYQLTLGADEARSCTVTLTGISGVEAGGGTIGLVAAGATATVQDLPLFIP